MSSAGDLPLLGRVAESIRVSWTSCVILHWFAWVVAHGGLSSSAFQVLLGREALAVWWSMWGEILSGCPECGRGNDRLVCVVSRERVNPQRGTGLDISNFWGFDGRHDKGWVWLRVSFIMFLSYM